ncbi:hypothetical protein N7516_002709 [Penicillium verrucosum]|uniref:uncharacterized protein n=1 Tax=Penicillium verrucosum TaxID=60171 RepID=UPI002545425C|nr:uncharacterized protein N7516_002709 [Penicillium verrucosum]KAJ5942541.1 hypothetical protein N7516_002709 [Penicillium verrucosum]
MALRSIIHKELLEVLDRDIRSISLASDMKFCTRRRLVTHDCVEHYELKARMLRNVLTAPTEKDRTGRGSRGGRAGQVARGASTTESRLQQPEESEAQLHKIGQRVSSGMRRLDQMALTSRNKESVKSTKCVIGEIVDVKW